jgi:glycerol-3-phosphate acyltransferase PlsY
MTLVLLVGAYLLGAIPTSYIVARVSHGIDLREQGSGNLGATNTYRVLGWKAALPVFLFDIAKGWAPAAMFPLWDGRGSAHWALAYGAAAIVGHVYSVFVSFRGGKGVATSAGVLLALAPLAMVTGLLVWSLVLYLTGYVSLGSIVAAAVVPVVVAVQLGIGPVFWLCLALAAFIVRAHRANIGRLRAGTESRFGRRRQETT